MIPNRDSPDQRTRGARWLTVGALIAAIVVVLIGLAWPILPETGLFGPSQPWSKAALKRD
jgi:hypothetical protein